MTLLEEIESNEKTARGKQYADESFAAILADQFQRNEMGKTEWYKEIIAPIDEDIRIKTPQQREAVLNVLRKGLTDNALTAISLVMEENNQEKNTHR